MDVDGGGGSGGGDEKNKNTPPPRSSRPPQEPPKEQRQQDDAVDDYTLWSGGLPPGVSDQEIYSHIRVMIRRFVDPEDVDGGAGGDAARANAGATAFASAPMGPRLRCEEYLEMVDDVLDRMQQEGELSLVDDGDSSSDDDDEDEYGKYF